MGEHEEKQNGRNEDRKTDNGIGKTTRRRKDRQQVCREEKVDRGRNGAKDVVYTHS
jgi:hypothetical protein